MDGELQFVLRSIQVCDENIEELELKTPIVYDKYLDFPGVEKLV